MNNLAHPSRDTIARMLENSASMLEIASDQRIKSVGIARDHGFTIQSIAAHIGRSYTATRALVNAKDAE